MLYNKICNEVLLCTCTDHLILIRVKLTEVKTKLYCKNAWTTQTLFATFVENLLQWTVGWISLILLRKCITCFWIKLVILILRVIIANQLCWDGRRLLERYFCAVKTVEILQKINIRQSVRIYQRHLD